MPQRPIVRRKQKQRRTKKLAEWRRKQEAKPAEGTKPAAAKEASKS
ncbi:MAG: hypothetical protein JRI68_00880 [Deltaproteobacteria bacterium]|nr:hypothetical protein [Deltaproteobacteria bacterium]